MDRLTSLGALLLLASTTAGCQGDNHDVYTFGALVPLTGSLAETGPDIQQALVFAGEHINAAGGVGGRPLRLRFQDSHSDRDRGPYQVNTLQAAGSHVASVVPKEGSTGWADTTMMHVDAPHPNCAYLWIRHSLDPKVQGDVAAWFGSVPVVPTACAASALLGPTGCQQNGIENFSKVSFWKTPIADCGNGETTCVPYSEWVSTYQAIMAGN